MGIIGSYIYYLFNAKSSHGIHSPFVYKFIEEYLSKDIAPLISSPIENIRRQLLNDSTEIDYLDFGAGSKIIRKPKPRVRSLAKTSLKPKKYAVLIAKLAQYINAQNIIELGTSLGTTTLYLSKLNPQAKIYTIEASAAISNIAQTQFDKLEANNIKLIRGNFDKEYPLLLKKIERPDLIFIDGNHTYEATIRYFNIGLEYAHKETIFVFDDINWSNEMKKAWNEIKNHSKTTISLDFFYLGVVSLNTDFSKEDLLIRY